MKRISAPITASVSALTRSCRTAGPAAAAPAMSRGVSRVRFTAAIVRTAQNPEQAKRLIAFLASDQTTPAIKNSGMQPAR